MSKPKPSPLIQFYPDGEAHVFTGNTAITVITQKTLRDPILPMFSLCLSDVGVWDSSFL